MSSIDRKLKRKREKEQDKKAKKDLRAATAVMNSLPPGCTECGAEFDLARDADGWIVNMAQGRLQLLCEKCSLSSSLPV
jgi:hypothetical protein